MDQMVVSSSVLTGQAMNGAAIAPLSQDEVIPLAREEFTRFMMLLDALSPADWAKPTACALWTVKDVVAHQASHVTGFIHWREMLDQFNPLNAREYSRRGMNSLDAANQRQVDLRANWTTGQLIAEMRDNSEKAFKGRQQFPFWLRWLRVPVAGYEKWISIGDLIDNIYTRDMWMHRLDICDTTTQEMSPLDHHDARITALAIRDLSQNLAPKLKGQSVIYQLSGKAGGTWIAGTNSQATATITLDALDFHRLASGRIARERALAQGLVQIEGDQALGKFALQHTVVLY